jgi:outer membrane immunogenic protein
MKHNVFGWAAAVAVSLAGVGAASAADMAVKARPAPVALFSWTGCYIGVSAGGKWVRAQDSIVVPAAGLFGLTAVTYTTEPDTWLAGGQVGCNMQSGNWVFGVEADAHAQRWSSLYTLGAGQPVPFVTGDQFGVRSDWQASVRGRVGYAMDRTLFYVTGGAAFTEVRAYTNWLPFGILPGTIIADTRTLTGWTIGAGVEHAVTNNFTLGIEGRYSDYGTQRFNSGVLAVGTIPAAALVFANSPTYREIKIETGEVMFKANWKFGPTAAVVVR